MSDPHFRRLTVEPFEGRVLPSRLGGPGPLSSGPGGPRFEDQAPHRDDRSDDHSGFDRRGPGPGVAGDSPADGRHGPGEGRGGFGDRVLFDRGPDGPAHGSLGFRAVPASVAGPVSPMREAEAAPVPSSPPGDDPPTGDGRPLFAPGDAIALRPRQAPATPGVTRASWDPQTAAAPMPSGPSAPAKSAVGASERSDLSRPTGEAPPAQAGGPVAPTSGRTGERQAAAESENDAPGGRDDVPGSDAPTPEPADSRVWDALADPLAFLGVPVAGAFPIDPAAVAGGAAELFDRLADLRAGFPDDAFGADASVWLGGAALVAGGVGYAAFLRTPRRPAAGRPGPDSVLARWDSRHAPRPG